MMVPMMHVEVDLDKCCCSGNCVLVAAEVFDQDDDGVVILLQENPSIELREKVLEAIMVCPVNAISLIEDDLST